MKQSIHDAFSKIYKEVLVTTDENEDNVIFKILESNLRFKLPSTLNTYLGLPKSYEFFENTSVSLLGLKEKTHRGHFLCLSNIVEFQHYGSRLIPLLKVIPSQKGIKGQLPVTVCLHIRKTQW